MTRARLVTLAAALGLASPAAADPDAGVPAPDAGEVVPDAAVPADAAEPADAAAAPDDLTAAAVAGAPVPGQESGRIDPIDRGDSPLRWIGRGVLFVPKVAFMVVLAPVRGTLWAFERFQIQDRTKQIFFNDAGTVGLYPTLRLESGFGLNVGARFVHRDLFGAREHLSLNAGTGGRFRQLYQMSFHTGDRLGRRLALELDAQYERRPKDAFHGIGNEDDSPGARFRQEVALAAAVVDVRVAHDLHARASGMFKDVAFGRSDVGVPIDEVYPTDTLVGWDGLRLVYNELELRWDSRRPATPWQAAAVHSAGWLVAGFVGRATTLDGRSDYWRFGGDLQHFIALAEGPRVLAGRLHAEAVDEGRDEVAFTELPRLGGKTFLRGYPLDRFRDRAAVLATLEYSWDLSRELSASLYVDAGRVASSISDLDVDGLHVGYGFAIEGHTGRSFLIRAMVASSIDGGLFVDIALDPVFDLDSRVERR